jgi:hypothetical protein
MTSNSVSNAKFFSFLLTANQPYASELMHEIRDKQKLQDDREQGLENSRATLGSRVNAKFIIVSNETETMNNQNDECFRAAIIFVTSNDQANSILDHLSNLNR